jgi:hypothetical protein
LGQGRIKESIGKTEIARGKMFLWGLGQALITTGLIAKTLNSPDQWKAIFNVHLPSMFVSSRNTMDLSRDSTPPIPSTWYYHFIVYQANS